MDPTVTRADLRPPSGLRRSLRSTPWRRSGGPVRETLDAYRIETTTDAVGLTDPPCAVRLRPFHGRFGPTLHAAWDAARGDGPVAWMASLDPRVLRVPDEVAPGRLQAEFRRWPEAWSFLRIAIVQELAVLPDGHASLLACDAPPRIESLLLAIRHRDPRAAGRPRRGRTMGGRLTRRQREALQAAVALGHYDLPRRVTMRGLADHLGIGHGSVSELLRRAERVVMEDLMDGHDRPS